MSDTTENRSKTITVPESDSFDWRARLLEAIASNGSGIIFRSVLHPDGRLDYSYLSDNVRDIYGLDPQRVTADSAVFPDTLHPDDRDTFVRTLRDSARHWEAWELEFRFIHESGRINWLHGISIPYRAADDRVAFDGLYLDITDRKVAEMALVESEQRFHNLAQNSLQGLMVHRHNKALFVNAAFAQILGYDDSEEVLTLENFDEYIAPEERPRLLDYRDRRIRGEAAPNRYEYQAIRKDGKRIWLEMLNEKVNWNHEPAIQSIIYDVTERKLAESAARKSNLRFRELLEQSTQGIMIKHEDEVVFANDAFADLHGYNGPDEILALDTTDALIAPDDIELLRSIYKTRANNLAAPTLYEFRGRRKDGSILWLENRVQKVEWDGQPAALVMSSDIGSRKHAEEALGRAKEEAVAANQAKSDFLSSMSHELRTPLNAVLGFGQLLASDTETSLSPAQRVAVDHILDGGQHLLSLISDLLDLARIESGTLVVSIEPLSAPDVIEEICRFASPLAEKEGLTLTHVCNDTDLPSILADQKQVRQVLLNLITNAIKYNKPEGSINVGCEVVAGDMLRISVADNGRGISVDLQSRLFERFDRLDFAGSEIEGTGIGLAITKRLVEEMGGAIGLASAEGLGSTFWFDLPIAKGEFAEPSALDSRVAKDKTTQTLGATEPVGVLYVEDNAANADLMAAFLGQRPDISLIIAETAERGIELTEAELPDVVLMDLGLPGINGFEALKKLRAHEQTRDVPVIAITADATRQTAESCRAAGFNAILTKPLDLEYVAALITEITAARLHSSGAWRQSRVK